MSAPTHSHTEWRVCAEHVEGEWLAWTVKVYVRTWSNGHTPTPWQCIREVDYAAPKGHVTHDYWKGLIRAAAK